LGGDGNIYTGRGWDYENSYGDKTLALQFLGDFMRYEPEEKQYEAMQFLLNYGKTENYLIQDYRIFGLNQTKLSKYSPGVNVMKRIKRLPRYSFCGEEGFEPCGKDINVHWNFNKSSI
jgi:peptidoglycan recognition protein LA